MTVKTELDQEWVALMVEAKNLGLSIMEVRAFLETNKYGKLIQ